MMLTAGAEADTKDFLGAVQSLEASVRVVVSPELEYDLNAVRTANVPSQLLE